MKECPCEALQRKVAEISDLPSEWFMCNKCHRKKWEKRIKDLETMMNDESIVATVNYGEPRMIKD